MTTLLPMALMYSIRNYEYSYGYTKQGQIFYEEYFPNALEILYAGKRASLYQCDPKSIELTLIPNEVFSSEAVPIVQERIIPDAYEALLDQERKKALVIRRYHQLSSNNLNWIINTQAEVIRKNALLNTPGPRADYYRMHYPQSWSIVEKEHNSIN